MSKVTANAHKLNLPEEKLLGDWIVCIPGFTLKKYRHLQRSRLSIFSMNCFGGCISNVFGLPFRSPFVNLQLLEQDFIKFLREPHSYIEKEPHFEKMTNKFKWYTLSSTVPLLSLEDISLNMTHYKKAEESISQWNDRKTRINWYNLLVIMFTNTKDDNEKILQEFDVLPYGKKVCFVPFKSDLDSAWYINHRVDKEAKSFTGSIHRFMFGQFFYYDPFDMLLYGKKTPLIDMD